MSPPRLFLLLAASLSAAASIGAEVKPSKWSGDLNVPDPTSVTFDEAGNAYVASTTRRKAGDLDIREHRVWIPDDVGLTAPEEKLAFYQKELAPGRLKAPRGGLKDHNKDGSVDWKDLTYHKERIYKLTDTAGDGVADKLTVFAEGFNSPVSGIAAGVLYFDGWVYLTAIPDVWRLKDTDGDGVADVKEVIATGFGGHIAYAGHDMHWLRLGPDGRIYWTVGDKGGNVTSKEGRRFFFAHEGAVLRCEPDGSGFEVFARGLRNTQEIAFDAFGNVIGVDNDGDQPRERERLMYLLEGSDSGWRNQHQYQAVESRWIKENMWMPAGAADQPLSITPPIANYSDGPAGFLFEPGHALDGDLRGHFILDQFPKGKMDAFTLIPDRDAFRQEKLRVINQGLMGIGMTWAPDGRAYFADWIGGYPLDGKGAVWRMDIAPNIDQTSEAVLSKPFSAVIPKEELLGLLGHRDQRVRINASIRLHRLGAWSEMLALALKAESPRFARIHAIWGYGMGVRLGKVADLTASLALLDDADSEIVVQTLKILSESRPSQALTDKVVQKLAGPDLRLRTQAGITLAKLGGKVPFASFLQDAEADLRLPWLRHGLVSGLAGTQSSEDLLAFAQSKSGAGAEAVFATLALVRRKSPLLAKLLTHANPEVVTEAARAIHDDEGIPAAHPALAAAFGQPNLPFHAARRALNANLRQGDEAALHRVLNWTIAQTEGAPLRLEALNVLSVFDQPPVLDSVDGTARKHPPRDPARIAALIRARQDDLLKLRRPEERALALSLLVKYEADLPFPILQTLAEDLKASPDVRLQTLRLLGRIQEEPVAVTRTLRNAAGEGNPSEVRIEALSQLFKRDSAAALEVGRLIIASKAAKTPEKQAVILALRGREEPAARSLLKDLVTRLASRQLDAGLKLDVFEVAGDSTDPAVVGALNSYLQTSGQGAPKLAAPGLPYELLIEGGDAARGKALVNGHLAANCTACHRIDTAEGSEVGPALRTIGSQRTKAELAESLVDPSAKIVPGFGVETIALKDGTTLAGSVLKESAKTLDIRLSDGQLRKLAVDEVAARTPPVSVMPPMLGILSPAEIRDVVAYLAALKPKAAKAKAKK